jgi:hypothetical protein
LFFLSAKVIKYVATCPFASKSQGEVFLGTDLFKIGVLILMDEVAILICDCAENKAATSFDVRTRCYHSERVPVVRYIGLEHN